MGLFDNDFIQDTFGVSGLDWKLRDEFTTAAVAPLTSPRPCEPGPGLITISDSGNRASIASGALTFTGGGSANPHFIGQAAAGLARVVGRMFLMEHTPGGARNVLGWQTVTSASNAAHGLQVNGTALTITDSATGGFNMATGFTVASSTSYQIAVIARTAGMHILIKGGAYSTWTLLWTDDVGSFATMYPAVYPLSNQAGTSTMSYWRIRDLAAYFNANNAIATVNAASPSGSYTATADQQLNITFTSPSSITAESGIRFRVTDASNYLWAGFTTAGSFQLRRYTSGTPTNLIDVASVISTSQTRMVQINMAGSTLDAYTWSGTTPTKRGSTITESQGNTQTGITTDTGSGWTAANLLSFPRTNAAWDAELDRVA